MAATLRAVTEATLKIVPDDFLWPPSMAATLRAVTEATLKIVPDDFLWPPSMAAYRRSGAWSIGLRPVQ
ncbi:hypothetical protein RYH70_00440 [Alloalcanivorax xenomutans]|uniref:hypothetical protein n=1 Tax=Alloalcanivorax xenomutans TaxID=1094342 RepID=UPI0029351F8D|nr:hypothetical protein [Alloalcanivorax xenomutans]WOD28535.1 hypothetical protein RYH70_00440 [Alloalcanivorax xenomutans]